MQQFVKFVQRFLTRNRATLLWFPLDLCGKRRDTDCGAFCRTPRFLPNATQFGKRAAFSRQKVPQSLDCGALQDSALRRGRQSAALLVGEKRRTCRHVFKCRCSVFVAIPFDAYCSGDFGVNLNILKIIFLQSCTHSQTRLYMFSPWPIGAVPLRMQRTYYIVQCT